MTEQFMQVPVSLIERIASELEVDSRIRSAGDLRSLLSQSTPTAEPVLTTEMDQTVRIVTNADNSMAWVYFDHGIALNRSEMLAFADALLQAAGVPGAPPIDQDPVMRLLEEVRLSEAGDEPPRIEDMAPGTMFTAERWVDGTRMTFERIESTAAGALLRSGDVHYGCTVINPSTIRDATPPAGGADAG